MKLQAGSYNNLHYALKLVPYKAMPTSKGSARQ